MTDISEIRRRDPKTVSPTKKSYPVSQRLLPSLSEADVEYSVILPTYNEKDNLPYIIYFLVDVFTKNKLKYEILVVDDGSPDGTADVFNELRQIYKDENLRILKRPGKLGLGTAYIDGLRHTKGKFVILMDADLSHHPKYIPQFIALQQLHDYDIVSGSRYIPGGGVAGWDFKRILLSRMANFVVTDTRLHFLVLPHCNVNASTNDKSHTRRYQNAIHNASDLTGSFRLYRREVLDSIMEEITAKGRVSSLAFFLGYVFQMEIIVRARAKGFTIGEVPIIFVDRLYGTSKLGTAEITGYLKGLLHLFWTV